VIGLVDYRTAWTESTSLIEDIPHPQRVHLFEDTYARASTGLVYPPHKLAEKVLDPQLMKDLQGRKGKTAFIFASGNSHLAGMNGKEKHSRLWYDYKLLPMTLTQVYAGRIAQACGVKDLVTTDASACASSLKVLMDVQSLMILNGFDRVVVLSFEDPISNNVLQFFGDAQASLSVKQQEEFKVIPSAFDSNNFGFYVGQGAVLSVFESARVMDKLPHAWLVSAYSASENSTNAIGQREDGEGFVKAIEGCLWSCRQLANSISVVKTHGTGTRSNNQAERNALDLVMTDNYVATSFKPTIGHTMGASGLLETCLLLDALKQTGKVPAIKNRTEADPVFLSEDAEPDSGLILSLAAGMGNIYSAAIFDPRV
jgi:3-oxoacyl-(acyl-carrier-protein) synthase